MDPPRARRARRLAMRSRCRRAPKHTSRPRACAILSARCCACAQRLDGGRAPARQTCRPRRPRADAGGPAGGGARARSAIRLSSFVILHTHKKHRDPRVPVGWRADAWQRASDAGLRSWACGGGGDVLYGVGARRDQKNGSKRSWVSSGSWAMRIGGSESRCVTGAGFVLRYVSPRKGSKISTVSGCGSADRLRLQHLELRPQRLGGVVDVRADEVDERRRDPRATLRPAKGTFSAEHESASSERTTAVSRHFSIVRAACGAVGRLCECDAAVRLAGWPWRAEKGG